MFEIVVQRASKNIASPSTSLLKRWAKNALKENVAAAEMTIRIVDETEMTMLNSTYRHKHKPTNVLSFPFDTPDEVDLELPLLGDIIICAAVVEEEARQQNKTSEAHWAHMIVHGTLHLLGFDHEQEVDAIIMEAKEIHILETLGFKNPYSDSQ